MLRRKCWDLADMTTGFRDVRRRISEDHLIVKCEGGFLYMIRDGVRIARRAHRTQPRIWVSLEPGWHVWEQGNRLVVAYSAPLLH
jgi:hypothetical protein